MKKKNGFISMALVYSFLVIFLFIMSSIIGVYLRKNTYLEALEEQVSKDIGITKDARETLISKIINENIVHKATSEYGSGNGYYINYAEISSHSNGNGLYYIDNKDETDENDDLDTSRIYFYRGNVNNNVVYGTIDGYQKICWKIIRTNENGTIRLIYNGTLAGSSGCSGANASIGKSEYNTQKYIGFSYGNTKSSIRNELENFATTIVSNNVKIVDAIYCNNGASDNNTDKNKQIIEGKVTHKCEQLNDRYSLISELSSDMAFDKNPIGLPTVADIIYAGGSATSNNTNYHLNSGINYWTMSPSSYDAASNSAEVYIVNEYGKIASRSVDSTDVHIRPVISINSQIKVSSGYGTVDEPYILENEIE